MGVLTPDSRDQSRTCMQNGDCNISFAKPVADAEVMCESEASDFLRNQQALPVVVLRNTR